MTTLLQIKTSLFSDQGQSTALANQFVEQWHQRHPDGQVVVRDLAANPVPHLTAERFTAFAVAEEKRTAEQQLQVAISDELIAEIKQADMVVLGLPMYNFGIPSTLKAWIDHVARPGQTFKYTENGPVGLVQDKPTYIFAARGGVYKDTPMDTQTQYVINFFKFIGINQVEFVFAEGLNMGDEPREQALEQANKRIQQIAA